MTSCLPVSSKRGTKRKLGNYKERIYPCTIITRHDSLRKIQSYTQKLDRIIKNLKFPFLLKGIKTPRRVVF